MQVGLSEDEFADLPRHLKQAARMGGAQGLLDAGFKDAPAAAGGEQQQREDTPWGERRQEGVHGASWKRQYVFVAATMPAEGDTSVGAEIAARFPEAAWLSGRQLHQSKRAVEHDWRRVEDSLARAEVLQASGGGRALLVMHHGSKGAGCQALVEPLAGARQCLSSSHLPLLAPCTLPLAHSLR